MTNKKQVVGAWALIVHQNRLLLVLNNWVDRAYGACWGAPGGAQERGESLEETVIREVHEETGLFIAIQELCFLIEYESFVAPYFSARIVGSDTLRIGDEITEVKFVPIEDLPQFAPGRLIARHPI